MINADMRNYCYYLYTAADEYGQPALLDDMQGTVRMAIYPTTKAVQDNINYCNAQYVGMTTDAYIDDTYVIQNDNGDMLKVLYIQPNGRYKQVFLGAMS